MKHNHCLLVLLSCIAVQILEGTSTLCGAESAPMFREFCVSPSGNDANPGTVGLPFRTLSRARDAVRAINRGMTGDIVVNLRGGDYPLTAPVEFTPADSGGNGFQIIYRAYNHEKPVISGGVPVSGWTLDHGRIYKAKLDSNEKLRTLYVNGVRASMTQKVVKGLGPWGEFDVQGTEPWALTSGTNFDGICFNPLEVPPLTNPSDVELSQARTWNFPIVCVREQAQENGFRVLKLQQPCGAIAATLGWGCGIDPKKDFTLRNAFEFLNKPGQFYFNRATHTLYYFARDGEDMNQATVIAPVSEGLLWLTGKTTGNRVQNLAFKGITFVYDHWLLKQVGDSRGFAGVQSLGLYTKYRADGNHHKGHAYSMLDLPQATVELRNCRNITFERNCFEHLSSGCALCLVNDVIECSVIGNVFQDISGNSINVGHPQHYYLEATPLFPAGVQGICAHIKIADNLIRKVCLEFKQEEALTGFLTQSVEITHNDIAGVPYGGIALGWGWGTSKIAPSTIPKDNLITSNKVVNTQEELPGDGGGIYVLGEQPGGRIEGNYVRSHARLYYPDEGSAYWTITRNVAEPHKGQTWLHIWHPTCHDLTINDNFTITDKMNVRGTRTPILNTHLETLPWSPQAQAVIDAAGLESAFKDIAFAPK